MLYFTVTSGNSILMYNNKFKLIITNDKGYLYNVKESQKNNQYKPKVLEILPNENYINFFKRIEKDLKTIGDAENH